MKKPLLRKLSISFVLLVLSLFVTTAYAATEYDCATGKHEYISRIIQINSEEQEGKVENTCIRCGYTYTEVLPATGHEWGEWVTEQKPTSQKPGMESRTCAHCGRVEKRGIPFSVSEETAVPVARSINRNSTVTLTDGVFVASTVGTWAYAAAALWYDSLVLNWNKQQLKKVKRRKKRNLI